MASKRLSLTALAALLAAAGCQTTAQSREDTLAAAGFRMKEATTPQQAAEVRNLPQNKLAHVSHNGDMMYVYADAKGCNCIYVGSPAEYGRYQNLAIKQRIAEEEEMASMNWDLWGDWGPWW